MTQTEHVLWLLRQRPAGITALDALRDAGSFRLAARINDLRRDGYAITSEMVNLPNGKRIAVYRLEEQPVRQELAL